VNSASYCEVLLKLRDAIRGKRPSQLARGVLLHHGNARPHRTRATQKRIHELQRELLEHPPYSPDVAPSDFHLFGHPNTTSVANVSLMTKRLKWRCGSAKDFYAAGFDALVKRWGKSINIGGGYVEK
jgi:histone-lysine N-methyltransferase SETMAR